MCYVMALTFDIWTSTFFSENCPSRAFTMTILYYPVYFNGVMGPKLHLCQNLVMW